MKQYEIEFYEKYSHGIYGKQHFTNADMILAADTIEQVKSFAIEVLAGMTYREVYGEKRDYGFSWVKTPDGKEKPEWHQADDKIGLERASNCFTVKARVFRG